VRRLTAWIGGTAAGIAAYRLLRRRSQVAPEAASAPGSTPGSTEPDTRADELREKLAESRTAEPPTEPVAEEGPDSPGERRQRVHEEGRAALDEMQTDDSAE
jgi:hypothetical protein